MPPAIRDSDHYVLKKLHRELLPWMVGGQLVRRQWFVILAGIYGYGGEVATALAGLGIGAPVVAVFGGRTPQGRGALDVLHEALPGAWFWVGLGALVVWVVVRLVITRQDAVARALYARDCVRATQRLYQQLYGALGDPNPLPKIASIQEAVTRTVGDAIEKNVWPWSNPQPQGKKLEQELQRQVDQIRMNYMAGWAPPPPGAG